MVRADLGLVARSLIFNNPSRTFVNLPPADAPEVKELPVASCGVTHILASTAEFQVLDLTLLAGLIPSI